MLHAFFLFLLFLHLFWASSAGLAIVTSLGDLVWSLFLERLLQCLRRPWAVAMALLAVSATIGWHSRCNVARLRRRARWIVHVVLRYVVLALRAIQGERQRASPSRRRRKDCSSTAESCSSAAAASESTSRCDDSDSDGESRRDGSTQKESATSASCSVSDAVSSASTSSLCSCDGPSNVVSTTSTCSSPPPTQPARARHGSHQDRTR